MVPTDFGPFFAATAAVAGALIGLLFVAISVAPAVGDLEGRVETDVRAGVAFSALVNTLTISLFALIPGIDLGTTAAVVGLVSLSSCVALGMVLYREGDDRRVRRHQARLLVVQGAVFAYQAWVGFRLARQPHDVGLVRTACILVIVLFLVGIARAWQLIGARDTGLLTEVGNSLRSRGGRRGTPPDGDPTS